MNAEEVKKHIYDTYGVEGDFPWIDDDSTVFRHKENRKWFALIMFGVERSRLKTAGEGAADALNLKCEPELALAIRDGKGILPAYHMNKEKWITVVLDGSVPAEQIKALIDVSYELTVNAKPVKNPKPRARKSSKV